MVRHRTDVDGCGCSRCQDVDTAVLERSLFDALRWSGRLPVRHPSILLVFGILAAAQALVLFVATGPVFVGALVGVADAFPGCGYVGVVGRGALARGQRSSGIVDPLRFIGGDGGTDIGSEIGGYGDADEQRDANEHQTETDGRIRRRSGSRDYAA